VLAASQQLSEKLSCVGLGLELSGDHASKLGDVGSHCVEHVCDVGFYRRSTVFDVDDSGG
jgi:hypothetical protein